MLRQAREVLMNRADEGASKKEEGMFTKRIESLTTQVPSATFLTVGLGAIAASAFFQLQGNESRSRFFGQWVPTILLMGLYNKVVKLHGSE